MVRGSKKKVVLASLILVFLAGFNLWGRYPFYEPDRVGNETDEIQLAPQRISTIQAGSVAAPSFSAVFGGNPYLVGPIVTPTTTIKEAETNIAIDPRDPATMVALITDYSLRPGGILTNGISKYAVTHDSGQTWAEHFLPLGGLYPQTGDNVRWLLDRDPGIGIDAQGFVYMSGLYLKLAPNHGSSTNSGTNSFTRDHTPGGVYICAGQLPDVVITNFNCHAAFTYTQPTGNTQDIDRDWLAADWTNGPFGGNVYVVWTHYTGCAGTICTNKFIAFSRSTDHGVTWSPFVQINTPDQTTVDWAQVTVGSDGAVYVSYQNYFMQNNLRQHWVAISTDGGATFGAPIVMTPKFRNVVFQATYRINSAPNVIVSSVPGAEYVYDVFAETTGTGTSIGFTRSKLPKAQGGFTAINTLNDSSAGQREYPAATVDANGTLHVVWLDTRNSPTVENYDVYASYSRDLGKTWAPNTRITPASINGNTDFLGDYFGITVEPNTGVAHAVWTNGGDLNGQLQTTTLTPQ